MNQKLEAIAANAASDLTSLIKEAEVKILEAWHAAEEDANDNDTNPKFKLAFNITLDIGKDHMETALRFGVKHKFSRDQQIPDPNQVPPPLEVNQAPLPPEGDGVFDDSATVQISSDGWQTAPMPVKDFTKAVRRVSKKLAEKRQEAEAEADGQ